MTQALASAALAAGDDLLELPGTDSPSEDPGQEAAIRVRVEEARRRGFRPLLALLERLTPGGLRLGTDAHPHEEAVLFRHDRSMAFHVADVIAVRELEGGTREVTTSFLGLSGGVSPLPSYISERVVQEDPDKARLGPFLDLFHHRLISLFYRALLETDFAGSHRSDLRDRWSKRVLAILGQEILEEAPADAGELTSLHLAPLLVERAPTCAALEAALADALQPHLGAAEVRVEEFVGGWVPLDASDRNRLGFSTLGGDLILGRKIYDRTGAIRVVVGPLSDEQFQVARRERASSAIFGVLRLLLQDTLDVEVLLWLSGQQVPPLVLGSRRLGRDTWLGVARKDTFARLAPN